MNITQILEKSVKHLASDIFIIAGQPLTVKINNQLHTLDLLRLTAEDTNRIINEIYHLANKNTSILTEKGDDDFSFAVAGLSRFRISTYKQRGSYAAVIRIISFTLPQPDKLGISDDIIRLVQIKKGLILVTGPAGSGKSTTQACMIDYINSHESKHIITLEDPIEYLHSHKQSIVSQREIAIDSQSYITALKSALRQAPDVILLGEMRDYETINTALTAAETGHVVISTLHTIGAAATIDRIIDVFPANQQQQIRLQLAISLETVISQQLVPGTDGQLIPVFEVMKSTPAIRNLIRENKIHQIDGIIASGSTQQMVSMDNSLIELVRQNKITSQTAIEYANHPDLITRKLVNR